MFKSKYLMVASLLLGSLAGLPGTMQRVEADQVYYVRQDLKGKNVMIVFVDGKTFGAARCVYQDGDSIGLESGGRTYYFLYSQIREMSY